MSDLTVVLKTILSADPALAALLPGGVYDSQDTPQDGGGADFTPRQPDGVRVNPYALIRWRSATEIEPVVVLAEAQTVEIYLYQDHGYSIIDRAVSRLKVMLHHRFLSADDRALAYTRQTFVSGELPSPEIGGGSCKFVRYLVTQVRK